MNKKGLVSVVANHLGMTQKKAEEMIDFVLDTVCNAAMKDGYCACGKNRFRLKKTAARRGRNPNTGESIIIPEKTFVELRRNVATA